MLARSSWRSAQITSGFGLGTFGITLTRWAHPDSQRFQLPAQLLRLPSLLPSALATICPFLSSTAFEIYPNKRRSRRHFVSNSHSLGGTNAIGTVLGKPSKPVTLRRTCTGFLPPGSILHEGNCLLVPRVRGRQWALAWGELMLSPRRYFGIPRGL